MEGITDLRVLLLLPHVCRPQRPRPRHHQPAQTPQHRAHHLRTQTAGGGLIVWACYGENE